MMTEGSGEVSSPMRFDSFQVYRITPKTTQQLEVLRHLEENSMDYNFWAGVSATKMPVDIMVPPHKKRDFLDLLDLQNFDAELWIENVQERIDDEKRCAPTPTKEYAWESYQNLDELNVWLDGLVKKFPGIVNPIVGGNSYEGRQIKGVKVTYKKKKKLLSFWKKTPIVFMEGGIHAREWISPATVTYILNQLLNSTEPKIRELAESREWQVFPCINPDGYVYTHTTDRMWRKNRRPFGKFFGVDLNRNWKYHWMDGGASANPKSENYAGASPFSEIETKSLSKYINSIANSIEVYLAFHSYSQKILSPYGHNGFEKPKNFDLHQRIGYAAAESLASRYRTDVEVGNWAETLYVSGGVSMDWAKARHKNIRLAYTFELRDRGRYGFVLPPEQIIPTGEETLDSVVRIFQELDKS